MEPVVDVDVGVDLKFLLAIDDLSDEAHGGVVLPLGRHHFAFYDGMAVPRTHAFHHFLPPLLVNNPKAFHVNPGHCFARHTAQHGIDEPFLLCFQHH